MTTSPNHDVNDPNNDIRRFQNAVDLVREDSPDLPDADREAALAFGEYKFNDSQPSTATANIHGIRKVAERAAEVGMPPVTDWEKADADTFLGRMKRGDLPGAPDGGWSEGHCRNTRQYLKNFFTYLGRDWADEIHIGAPPDGKVDRKDLLTQDELRDLFGAIDHPRDECLVALPLASMQRVGALLALRIKDYHPRGDGQTGYITLNADAYGQKRATGKRPLSWSTGYVEKWLSIHPRRDDPEAPLLCVRTNAGDAVKGSELKPKSYREALWRIARRAGLREERYKPNVGRKQATLGPHLLRHTAITRAVLNPEISDQIIKRWAGWGPNSTQLENYIHTEDDDVLEAVDTAYGVSEGTSSELAYRPDPGTCPGVGCDHPTEAWMKACPKCTLLLSDTAAETAGVGATMHDSATADAIEATDEDTIEANQLVRRLTEDPDALQTLRTLLETSDGEGVIDAD